MKNVLITGGNRGLGKTLALKVAKAGHRVYITARDLKQATEVSEGIKKESNNENVQALPLVVSNEESIKQLLEICLSNNIIIDVLVNNAGVADKYWEEHPDNGEAVFKVNYFGVINLTNTLRPVLAKNAKIIVISSGLGKLAIQPQIVQDLLSNPIDENELNNLANQVIQGYRKSKDVSPFSNLKSMPIYAASKVLINAYFRHVFSQKLEPEQSFYLVEPGHCNTDLGGENAPYTVEEGTIASFHIINDLPFQRGEKHGQFLNQKGEVSIY